MRKTEAKARADLYARITDKIAADLEKGVRPWVQPWNAGNLAGEVSRPLRHNGQPYSGINVLLLWSEALARGFQSSTWMTFKLALELDGTVRKGETGSMVVFASRFTKSDVDGSGEESNREIPFLRAYTVFNVLGSTACRIAITPPWRRLRNAMSASPRPRFFANTRAVIRHSGGKANRDLSRYAKDKTERAREELIAELSNCFLCADLGVAPELEPRGAKSVHGSRFRRRRLRHFPGSGACATRGRVPTWAPAVSYRKARGRVSIGAIRPS